jgi:hypothetical protein
MKWFKVLFFSKDDRKYKAAKRMFEYAEQERESLLEENRETIYKLAKLNLAIREAYFKDPHNKVLEELWDLSLSLVDQDLEDEWTKALRCKLGE